MSSLTPRAVTRLGERFDRRYRQSIQAGLAVLIWFSVFANAAYDLWAASLVFAILTALSILLIIGHSRTKQVIQLPLIGPVLVLLAVYLVSSNSSFDVVSSRFECWVWFYSFVAFYLLINCAQTTPELNSFFVLSSYVLVPLALFCVYLRINNRNPEVHATLINSIILSGFALYWLFFLWQRGFQGSNAISLIAVTVILLLGRSWWVVFSLAFGFMYYYQEALKTTYIKRRSAFLSMIFLLLVICGAALFFKFSRHQASGYADSNRMAWWIAAVKMTALHPIMGVGLGSYSTAYPYFHTGRGLNSLFAHNFPLQLLAETGFLGVFSLLWLAQVIYRRMKSHRVFIATLITVCCYSLVQINMEYFLNKLMFVFVLAPLIRPDESDWKIEPGRSMVIGVLVLLLLIPSWLTPWMASIQFVEGTRHEDNHEWSSARESYRKAAELDQAYGDAYAGLARTYRQAYRRSGSAADLAEWRAYLGEAFHWKKSIRFFADLEQQPQ